MHYIVLPALELESASSRISASRFELPLYLPFPMMQRIWCKYLIWHMVMIWHKDVNSAIFVFFSLGKNALNSRCGSFAL